MPAHQPATATRAPATPAEDIVCYGLAIAIGLIPVVPAVVRHACFDAEPTIGLGMVVAGAIGLVAAWRASR